MAATKVSKKPKIFRKLLKKSNLDQTSPLKRQLIETKVWTDPEWEIFKHLPTSRERVCLIYDILPDDAISLDRLWPVQISQKNSRIRRELSENGKNAFLAKDYVTALHYYNEACSFSTGKGLAHTLARRAAFLFQIAEVELALRDVKLSLELGCLESELLEFLLAHHVTDEKMSNDCELGMQNQHLIDNSERSRRVMALMKDLDSLNSKEAEDKDVKRIMNELKKLAQEDMSFEPKEFSVLKLKETNEKFESMTKSADVVLDKDKGRLVVATEDIEVGQTIIVERPNTIFFIPEAHKLPMLKSHCLHCLRYSRAPLPCPGCCMVVFCSEKCQKAALSSYHGYECKMKLYEMLQVMGDEFIDVFLAIRAITQHDIDYFVEREQQIYDIIDSEFPELSIGEENWSSDEILNVLRLMGHQGDIDEQKLMNNAVTAVFLLRALQFANYFDGFVDRRRQSDRRLRAPEKLMLCVLNQLLNIESSNAKPFLRLISARNVDEVVFRRDIGSNFFQWERLGLYLSSTMALVNHSCDANALQFQVGSHVVLVAAKHICKGEEITESYDFIDYGGTALLQRQLHLLRKYFFECNCDACIGDWCQYDDMADRLYEVPSFEFESLFVERMGDKKDLVNSIDILTQRAQAEFKANLKGDNDQNLDNALKTLDELSSLLEKHIAKPHQYHVQIAKAIRLALMRKYLHEYIEAAEHTDFEAQMPPKFDADGRIITNKKRSATKKNSNKINNNVNNVDKESSSNGVSNGDSLMKSLEMVDVHLVDVLSDGSIKVVKRCGNSALILDLSEVYIARNVDPEPMYVMELEEDSDTEECETISWYSVESVDEDYTDDEIDDLIEDNDVIKDVINANDGIKEEKGKKPNRPPLPTLEKVPNLSIDLGDSSLQRSTTKR